MGIKVIGFDGSTRSGSTTSRILAKALDGVKSQGAEVETIVIAEHIKEHFHGAYDPLVLMAKEAWDSMPKVVKKMLGGKPSGISGKLLTDRLFPDEIKAIIRKIEAADGFIMATPTWWSAPSGYLMTLLHFLTLCEYRNWSLEGKVAGLIAICEEDGAQHVNMLLANALSHMGVHIPPYCSLFYNVKNVGKSEDDWQETDQELVGVNVVRMIKTAGKTDWGYPK